MTLPLVPQDPAMAGFNFYHSENVDRPTLALMEIQPHGAKYGKGLGCRRALGISILRPPWRRQIVNGYYRYRGKHEVYFHPVKGT
jgi:hypothetical protein